MHRSRASRAAMAAALVLLSAAPALAHHPMGGEVPRTLAHGLLSGLGHPVIGVDHLAMLVGAGLLAARFNRGLALVPVFVGAMLAGVALHLGRIDLPEVELLIALSVVTVGAAAALRPTLPFPATASLFAAAGLVHGHALAESIIGAEPMPLAAYLVGLTLVQAGIIGAILIGARLIARTEPAPALRLRLAGLAVAAVGLVTAGLQATGA
jgi:urease accessory protein